MKAKIGILVALALGLGGCAGVTDVVSTGPGTFMVASHGTMGWSSGGAQKADAIQRASEYCRAAGKQVQLINARETNGGGFGQIAAGEAEFRCVAP